MRTLLTASCILVIVLLAGCEEKPSSNFALKDTRDRDIEIMKAGDYDDALQAYRSKDYQLAYEKLKPMAEAGYSAAQTSLGHLYAKGLGVYQDYSEASYWYRRAADQGLPLAQVLLANLYIQGLGVEQDHKIARQWYELAAKNGSPNALVFIGSMFDFGEGVPQSDKLAYVYYTVGLDYMESAKYVKPKFIMNTQRRLIIVIKKMSSEEIEEAERLIPEWKAKYPATQNLSFKPF